MKYLLVAAVALLLTGTAAIGPVLAQGKPSPEKAASPEFLPVRVAVVDISGILGQADAMRQARQQIDAMRVRFQEEITALENKLRAEDQELNRQRAILSPEALNERRQRFSAEVSDTQRKVQERKTQLNQALGGATREVQKVLIGLIAEYAGKEGYTLVLARSQVVLSDQRMEISEIMLKRLNERLPTIKVNFETGAKPETGGR